MEASKRKMVILISTISMFLMAGIGTCIWYFTKDIGKSKGGIEDYFEKEAIPQKSIMPKWRMAN
ncbi:MAG: hypothetical protein IPN09_12560 [Bacteroidetes bacterium]|nr:hypothetical protein [Bacteroidota bacterium]